MPIKLLRVGKRIYHGLKCLIIVIVDVHLLHLLHHVGGAQRLQAHTAGPVGCHWLVDQGDLGDLGLVLHPIVASAHPNAMNETVLGRAVFRTIPWRRDVLLHNVKMARRRPNTIGHVLRLIVLNV
jgi:hypothetical protein